MTNLFQSYNAEDANNNIKSAGTPGIYTPGIHTATGAKVYLFETEWEGTKYTNAEIVISTENGGVLVDSLKCTPNSNQTEATTNFLTYMHNIAVVTDKISDLEQLKTKFGSLPKVKYTDRFKREHDALEINIFVNSKFKFMTHSEISGDANGIYTNQKLTLNQVFRYIDNAALNEIKDDKEAGASYAYWSDDNFANCHAKTIVQYSKNRDESDAEVLEVIVDYLKEGNKFTKEQLEKIQNHFEAGYAKQVLSGSKTNTTVDTSDVDAEDDDNYAPTFI